MTKGEKIYLGDSVYLEFTGHDYKLTTEDGRREMNVIFLDEPVAAGLHKALGAALYPEDCSDASSSGNGEVSDVDDAEPLPGEIEVQCPECLVLTFRSELDLFGGLCEACHEQED